MGKLPLDELKVALSEEQELDTDKSVSALLTVLDDFEEDRARRWAYLRAEIKAG